MSVVQRCPNCGTTQASSGECEACHEAHVRFFCTNHDPGIWLSGPTCPQCAARAVAAAPPVRPRLVDDEVARPALWQTLLSNVLARRASRADEEPRAPAGAWVMRLLSRLVLIAVVVIGLFIGAIYLVARSMH